MGGMRMLLADNRRFAPIADREDMRRILVADLLRKGAEKRLTAALLEMVHEAAADVFISTDEDEGVLLKVAHDQYEPRYVILIKGGFKAVEVRALAS
jgi:hypothetical protein